MPRQGQWAVPQRGRYFRIKSLETQAEQRIYAFGLLSAFHVARMEFGSQTLVCLGETNAPRFDAV